MFGIRSKVPDTTTIGHTKKAPGGLEQKDQKPLQV